MLFTVVDLGNLECWAVKIVNVLQDIVVLLDSLGKVES